METARYRSVIEIWVTLGDSTAKNGKSHKNVDSGWAHHWPFLEQMEGLVK